MNILAPKSSKISNLVKLRHCLAEARRMKCATTRAPRAGRMGRLERAKIQSLCLHDAEFFKPLLTIPGVVKPLL